MELRNIILKNFTVLNSITLLPLGELDREESNDKKARRREKNISLEEKTNGHRSFLFGI